MTLRIYNTMTGRKEEFIPLEEGVVKMYICGMTVYDNCHLGHARAAVVFDVIYRFLSYLGYRVHYIRNITDVDDKIIKRANEEGISWDEIAGKYTEAFWEDMKSLSVLSPLKEPKATEHISEMIALIEKLIEKGVAYQVDGDVYYSVEKFSSYGKLSRRSPDEMEAGARIEVDERKRNPMDFALWKSSKPGEPAWESPWGKGRPGWHIECSAMSMKYLGESFDIHGGGKDLIFPHHENEIAQSEAATGKPFAKYWIHNGFVQINREKMSKSLGNFFTIQGILDQYHPDVVRFFLLTNHYRSPIDFSDQALSEAEKGIERFYTTLFNIEQVLPPQEMEEEDELQPTDPMDNLIAGGIRELFDKALWALNDDFNTAGAIGYTHEMVTIVNHYLADQMNGSDSSLGVLRMGYQSIKNMGTILGILSKPPAVFLGEFKAHRLKGSGLTEKEILELIQKRNDARKNKDWKTADVIRDDLVAKGILLEDGPSGTRWRVKRS